MTPEDALIDAALTVQRWKRLTRRHRNKVRVYTARRLECPAIWDAIEAEIVRRIMIEKATKDAMQ